jgi:hypothetical protein
MCRPEISLSPEEKPNYMPRKTSKNPFISISIEIEYGRGKGNIN